jgi:hypothetical protein
MSLLCAVLLEFMDTRAERILKRNTNQEGQVMGLTDGEHFPAVFCLITVICIAYYVAMFPFIALGK